MGMRVIPTAISFCTESLRKGVLAFPRRFCPETFPRIDLQVEVT